MTSSSCRTAGPSLRDLIEEIVESLIEQGMSTAEIIRTVEQGYKGPIIDLILEEMLGE